MTQTDLLNAMRLIRDHCDNLFDCVQCAINDECDTYFRVLPEGWRVDRGGADEPN